MHKFDSLSVYSGITGSLLGTASSAATASYIEGTIEFSNGLDVTGSLVVTGGITGSLSGSIASASYAATASLLLGMVTSASYALTASYALNSSGVPVGTVSSSAQIILNDTTGNLSGSRIEGNVPSASSALTASLATTYLGTVTTASYAETASYSSVAQTLLGSVETASYALTSSYSERATTSSYAESVSGFVSFPEGLDVTGSLVVVSGSITGSLFGTASFAQTAATASYFSGSALFENGLVVTGSVVTTGDITGSGLLMTTRAVASASAGGTYTSTEQDLLNQIRATLIKYGMLS